MSKDKEELREVIDEKLKDAENGIPFSSDGVGMDKLMLGFFKSQLDGTEGEYIEKVKQQAKAEERKKEETVTYRGKEYRVLEGLRLEEI